MMESAASAMIWNFEEGLGADSTDYITESLGASSAGSDGDHHLSSALIASIGPRSHSIPQAEACGATTISLLDVRDLLEPMAPPPLEQVTRCPTCMETFREPKVLACFHSFCKPCLKRQYEEGSGGVLGASSADSGHGDSVNTVPSPTGSNRIVCQLCSVETQLSPQLGVEGLLSDYGLEALLRKAGGGDHGPSTSPAGSDQKQDHQPGCETNIIAVGGVSKTGEKKSCTGCKSGEPAFAYCVDCSNHLCAGCTQAHRNMHCFEGHRVEDLFRAAKGGSRSTPPADTADAGHCKCLEHRSQALHFFCATCNLAICRECTESEHTQPSHQVEAIADVAEKQIAAMELLNTEARRKYTDLVEAFRSIDAGQTRLNASLQAAKATIDASAQAICHMVLEAQKEMLRELENTFGYKQYRITCVENDLQRLTKKMSTTMDFTQRLLKHSSPTEVMVFKPLLDSRLKGFINFNFNSDANTALLQSSPVEIRPVDLPQVRQAIFCLFSSMRARVGEDNSGGGAGDDTLSATGNQFKTQPHLGEDNDVLSFPYTDILPRQLSGGGGDGSNGNSENSTFADFLSCVDFAKGSDSPPDSFRGNAFSADIPVAPAQHRNNTFSTAQMIRRGNANNHQLGVHYSPFEPRDRTHQQPFGVSAPVGNGPLSSRMFFDGFAANGISGGNQIFNSQYEKWSAAMDPSSLGALSLADPETINDLSILAGSTEKLLNGGAGMGPFNPGPWQQHQQHSQQPVYSSRSSHIKRLKMTYHCKFGEFGVLEGQFTEPSGVAVNSQSDIVVADTNNHRIQVFDREGRFKFQFGECGKRDGQLLYPNRVAVNRVTGDFIVTERSPTHQIQIYNQYGQFIRKFGANILQHPRGVCVDHQGRIIVVECKVMRVIIFDTQGNEFRKFSCSRYLEFPNGVCATSNNEILISDNRAHCVKVFDYEGLYLRQIGGEGITNYPIGVGLNSKGEVVVADNHNNFNLTTFSQDGTLLYALESKVKHAQCFDVALVDDGSVVLASKDYRLYLYRYQYPQNQPSCIGGDNPHHAMHSFYPFS